jgi:Protein of unknown function (DUF3606)
LKTRSPQHRRVKDGQNRGPQDRSRVNTEQDYEIHYWTQEFGVTEDQLRQAVQRVGSSADKVREHLRQGGR